MTEENDDLRRQTRADADHLAALKTGGEIVNARVLDVAMTGARVMADVDLAEADTLVFKSVRMGERPAEVVWLDGNIIGLGFTDLAAQDAERRGLPPARHWLSALRRKD